MALEIYFFGLIAHVQVENSDVTRAVLVDAHGHAAGIFIPASANPRLSDPHVPPSTVDGVGNRLIDIKNWNVHIANAPTVQTARDTSFNSHVVELTSCLVDSDSTKRRINGRVHRKEEIPNGTFSYFDYQGGTIATSSCYEIGATFDSPQPTDPECVAQTTRCRITLTDPVVLTFTKGRREETVTIDANSSIWVFNFAPGHGHFPEFRDITDAGHIRQPTPNPQRDCRNCPADENAVQERDRSMLPAELSAFLKPFGPGTVECTQTRYP